MSIVLRDFAGWDIPEEHADALLSAWGGSPESTAYLCDLGLIKAIPKIIDGNFVVGYSLTKLGAAAQAELQERRIEPSDRKATWGDLADPWSEMNRAINHSINAAFSNREAQIKQSQLIATYPLCKVRHSDGQIYVGHLINDVPRDGLLFVGLLLKEQSAEAMDAIRSKFADHPEDFNAALHFELVAPVESVEVEAKQ